MGYVPSAWATFEGALAAVAGAMTGLRFVAVSLDGTALSDSRGLRSRAAQSLVLFATSVLVAVIVATRQPATAVGSELVVPAILSGAALALDWRTGQPPRARRSSTRRTVLAQYDRGDTGRPLQEFGSGITQLQPGTLPGIQLVVSDAAAARQHRSTTVLPRAMSIHSHGESSSPSTTRTATAGSCRSCRHAPDADGEPGRPDRSRASCPQPRAAPGTRSRSRGCEHGGEGRRSSTGRGAGALLRGLRPPGAPPRWAERVSRARAAAIARF